MGLGINTEAKPNDAPNSAVQNSAIDSLFDFPDNSDTNMDMDYENMEFSFGTDPQGDQTQTQSNDFDFSSFGNISQDITMNGTNTSDNNTTGEASNNANDNNNKQLDNSFDLGNTGGDDNMNLDLSMFGAEDSVFDDMFVDGGGGGLSAGGGGEMQHGNFDADFFGLDN